MRRVFLGLLFLLGLGFSAAPASGASQARGKTIKDFPDTFPLGILQRSVTPKFYQSLLVSPLHDWTIVRTRVTGSRAWGARVLRSSVNPAYNSIALKFANELMLPKDASESGQADSAVMHLLIYQIADGVMAVSFAYRDALTGPQLKNSGTVRLSVKTKEDRWTEIKLSETSPDKRWLRESGGRRIRKMDRMPMDIIAGPQR
jgi:hypothetical protein